MKLEAASRAIRRAQPAASRPRLEVRGKFFFAGDEKVPLRGVTYGPFAPDANGYRFPAPEVVARDLALITELGANCLRLFTPPPRWLLDLATHLASEVQRARARAELLALRTVRERLEGWLAFHGELPARGRWIAVANEIGVTPEALYRELARHPAPAKRAIPLAR